jgi:hypothetical protein
MPQVDVAGVDNCEVEQHLITCRAIQGDKAPMIATGKFGWRSIIK